MQYFFSVCAVTIIKRMLIRILVSILKVTVLNKHLGFCNYSLVVSRWTSIIQNQAYSC